MKKSLLSICFVTLYSCSSNQETSYVKANEEQVKVPPQSCIGSSELPEYLKSQFVEVKNDELLAEALGAPNAGKLCQGKVYQSKEVTQVTLHRAWNSTNPGSKFGNWWAFNIPAGKVYEYRSDYEICPSWSPLDKLVTCTLKSGTTIVVGTGQSAECSQYLTYPVSEKQQVYIDAASESVENCTSFDGVFSWK